MTTEAADLETTIPKKIKKKRDPNTQRWASPQFVFDALNKHFNFTLDVCAEEWSAKCPRYFTEEIDGKSQKWDNEVCWCNPPYSEIDEWLAEGLKSARHSNTTSVFLLHAKTETAWFHQKACHGEIYLIQSRLPFIHPVERVPKGSGQCGSIIVVFDPKTVNRTPFTKEITVRKWRPGIEEFTRITKPR